MPSSKSSGGFKPFKKLDRLMASLPDPLAPPSKNYRRARPQVELADDQVMDEAALFKRAMADVQPISHGHRCFAGHRLKRPLPCTDNEESESLKKLKRLITSGEGFVIADTPEYVAGADGKMGSVLIERLHRGDFAIQGHIDLHGLTVPTAQEAVASFLKESVLTGKRGVLIVHGRGLSSPGEPVLKTQVIAWLTRGPWRKWVMAYTSARSCDGGTGATYVLLRSRAQARRNRKSLL